MSHRRALERARAVQMAQHRQFDVIEPHVRPEPAWAEIGLALVAFRRAGRLEGRLGCKVRLADECGFITAFGERAGETLRTDFGIKIDAVVPHAMRQWQQSSEYGRARLLAYEVGRDAGIKARAVTREPVEMRRFDFGALETVAVAALLVGSDKQNVRALGHCGL